MRYCITHVGEIRDCVKVGDVEMTLVLQYWSYAALYVKG
jgi:hypothetical protein